MKKLGSVPLAAIAVVVALAGEGRAQHGHGGGHGGVHGGGHGSGFHHGGGHAFIGIGPGWWGYPYYPHYPYWYPPPYYGYVPPPYYGYGYPPPAPPEEPSEYAQRRPERPRQYWYYCPNAKAYYPKVRDCPEDWVRVLPREAED